MEYISIIITNSKIIIIYAHALDSLSFIRDLNEEETEEKEEEQMQLFHPDLFLSLSF